MSNKLHLTIVSQEKKLLDAQVDEVIAPASQGEVAILPEHIPLFTKLNPGELRYKQGNKEYSVVVSSGFLNVDDEGKITVIVDSAYDARSLSLRQAKEAIKAAQENLKTAKSKQDRTELIKAEAALRFALLQEKIAEKAKRA